MPPGRSASSAAHRAHIVLVPGFAGFDALGQLEYFAGVTPLFRAWRDEDRRGRGAVLHYFDSFPTASVATRAARLGRYLAKRVARGEFQDGDTVALVGHSTGGLDIRCLLDGLADAPREGTRVDGDRRTASSVSGSQVLDMVNRVAFLSVPQRGTNIADWVAAYGIARELFITELRASVGVADLPLVGIFQDWATAGAAWLAGADALLAVQDALREADTPLVNTDPARTADAYEAASALALWLRQMATNFSVINDLAVRPPAECGPSPAHASEADRAREVAAWKRRAIATRSYATLGRPPVVPPDGNAPTWDPIKPWTWLPCRPAGPRDALYHACYRACAGGPFAVAEHAPADGFRFLRPSHRERLASWRTAGALQAWENDGIVNTASMTWPGGEETFLVPADHMDIVGHYRRELANDTEARTYHTYDLLGSESGFGEQTFGEVWEDVFGFCCS